MENAATPPKAKFCAIERIREYGPDIMMSAIFIVGFPEEREADFQATLDSGLEQAELCLRLQLQITRPVGHPFAAGRPQVDAAEGGTAAATPAKALINAPATRHSGGYASGGTVRTVKRQGATRAKMLGKSEYCIPGHNDNSTAQVGDCV